MRNVSKLSSRQIGNLYKQGYSTQQIADKAGISARGIHHHLRKTGVPRRPRGNKIFRKKAKPNQSRISVQKMAEQYNRGFPVRYIAKTAGISQPTARKKLIGAGVKMRPRGTSNVLKISILSKHNEALLAYAEKFGGTQL